MVDLSVWNRKTESFSDISVVFDTGASVTTLSKDILHLAGYDVSNGSVKRITTASGIEYVREIVLDKIKIGALEMSNIPVYAHTFPQECFSSGLLGLNVLSRFDVNLLFSCGKIELSKINRA
jgi:clan AA aspartic protease (TIGR02281 family)